MRVLLPLALLLGAATAATATGADTTASAAAAAAAAATGEGGAPRLPIAGAGDDEGDAFVRLLSEHWEDVFAGVGEEGAEEEEDGGSVTVLSPEEIVARIDEAKRGRTRRHMQIVGMNKNSNGIFGARNKKQKEGFNAQGLSETDAPVGAMQGKCAWQTYVTGRRLNVAFPDLQAVYQILVMQGVDSKRIFRIRGKFPTKGVRYFSLQSNNVALGTAVSTIVDYQITPDAGSGVNPYATENGSVGTYTINVTPTGDQGLANELSLCPAGKRCTGKLNAVMIMRFYTSDADLPPANSKVDPPGARNPRLWGYESPPTVETRRVTLMGQERWTAIPTCDQGRPTRLTNIINSNLESSIPGFPEPITHNMADNFILYVGDSSSGDSGLYANMDATYLMSIGYQGAVDNYSTKLVAKITGVLPKTARNFQSSPRIARWQDYEVRYTSFSTITMETGGPTIDSLDDAAFERKYGQTDDWKEGKRTFSIVVGPSPDKTCGVYNEATDLFLTTTHRGAVADYWGILDRQLVPAFARNGFKTEGDRSLASARVQCAKDASGNGCVNPVRLEELMGDYYPHIQWFECQANGALNPITKTLASTMQ